MQNQKRHRDTLLNELLAADRAFIEGVMSEMPPVALNWARSLQPKKGAIVVLRAVKRTDGIVDEPSMGCFGLRAVRILAAAEAMLAHADDLHSAFLVSLCATPSSRQSAIEAVADGNDAKEAAETLIMQTAYTFSGYFWAEDFPSVRNELAIYLIRFLPAE